MRTENTADGLVYLLATFQTFPILQWLLLAFALYLILRASYTFYAALPACTGKHYLEGRVVYQGIEQHKYTSTNVKVGDQFLDFSVRTGSREPLPELNAGDPVRIYHAPNNRAIRFLWIPTRWQLGRFVVRRYVITPLLIYVIAVILFWMTPLLFIIG